jgi:hypothetical protein
VKIYFLTILAVVAFASSGFCSEILENGYEVFQINSYLKMAEELERLPHDKAISLLKELSFSDKEYWKVIILCRMMFTPKLGSSLRRPYIGSPLEIVGITPIARWGIATSSQLSKLLDPIVLIGNIPLEIAVGYISCGSKRENASDYINYCDSNGEFGKNCYKTVSRKEMELALDAYQKYFAERALTFDEMAFIHHQMQLIE